jgi:hypothetical protein
MAFGDRELISVCPHPCVFVAYSDVATPYLVLLKNTRAQKNKKKAIKRRKK